MEDSTLKFDITQFVKIIIREKLSLFAVTIIFFLLGFFYTLSLKEEFQASGKILPEVQGKGSGLGQFSGLASLAGVDLNSLSSTSGDAIRPDLYPVVLNSTQFYLELFKIKVKTKDNQEISFEEYYHKYIENNKTYTEEYLKEYQINELGLIVLNKRDLERIDDLRLRVNSSIDMKTGLISIQAKMQDPVVAALVTKFTMDYLMDYISKYRTSKLRKDVDYLANQVSATKGKYFSTQEQRARYSDQYQSNTIRLQSSDLLRERLESEYRVSSSFYNELLKKYEEAKLKLEQEAPVFKVLEYPVVPINKIEPRKSIIIIGFTIIGILLGIIVAILKNRNYKLLIKEA